MTIHKEEVASDVDAIQVWSVKELEAEFTPMLKAYHDKETEFNWEAREKSITRIRGLLRGNAVEPPYLEVLLPCIKQMVDGIIKAVESLRTQLAVKALLLVGEIGVFIGKHVDAYITEHLLMCMMRCASLTKKMVANASLEATKTFLKHTHFYPKFMSMLLLSMADKNSQVRLYVVLYTKTLLQAHAHREHTRMIMDRTNSTDHFETIITKGLNDATPIVKESCREAFWIFWEYWRERGDHVLRQLPAIAQKQLEKSKTVKPQMSKSTHSPTESHSSGRHDLNVSPSNSSHIEIKRSLSPRASSPHLRSNYGSPPAQIPTSASTSPPPPSSLRKTRVPALNRKKSAISLVKRKAPANFMILLTSEDPLQRMEGLIQLAKKLSAFDYMTDVASIQLDVPNAPPVDGPVLKATVTQLWDDGYEVLSSWDGISHIIMRLFSFEECIPKLILDANMDETARRTEADIAKSQFAQLGFIRAKVFLESQHPDLVDTLFTNLVQYGGFVQQVRSVKKDNTRLPANRRKLTKQFLEWLDELVTPLIGLNEDVDYGSKAYEGIPKEFLQPADTVIQWFESDDNVRHLLAILLPLITTSTSGTLWHAPLVTFIKHIRLLNQRLFEMVTATYDEYSVNKICRVLGIHIRVEPIANVVTVPLIPEQQQQQQQQEEEEEDLMAQAEEEEDLIPAILQEEPIPTISQEEPSILPEEKEEEEKPTFQQQEEPIPQHKESIPIIQHEPEPIPTIVTPEQQPISNTTQEQESVSSITLKQESIPSTTKEQELIPTTQQQEQESTPPVIEAKEEQESIPTLSTQKPILSMTQEEQEPVPTMIQKESMSTPGHQEPPIPNTDLLTVHEQVVQEPSPPVPQETKESYFEKQDYFEKPIKPELYPTSEPPVAVDEVLYQDPNDTIQEQPLVDKLQYLEKQSTEKQTPLPDRFTPPQEKQQQQQQYDAFISTGLPAETKKESLVASKPNPEKYPLPTHVPFFAPEKVNFPNPVFKQNVRTLFASPSTSTSNINRNAKDKTMLLYALIDKLKTSPSDHQTTFRKMTRLFKEVPIRRRWDQGGIEENGSETWAGAQGDAGNFVEVVQTVLPYLDDKKSVLASIECMRQLAVTQAGLFRFFERKVDEKGRTLESQLLEKLLLIRSSDHPTICIAAEDTLDAVLGTLNPPTVFEMLMAFIIYRLLISPLEHYSADTRYHPVGSAFMYLGKWVKEVNDNFYIDEWLSKGGVNAFFEGINHPLINIRKSCVEAIVAFQEVMGDDIYVLLADLREDQMNLVKHYVAKALKKKASLRNLRDNGQF